MELVEGILKANGQDYDEQVSQQIKTIMEKSNSMHGKHSNLRTIEPKVTSVDEVYTELIQLRNKNRALEGRIKQLENQNFNITRSNFTHVHKHVEAHNIHSEPNRPHFHHQSLDSNLGTGPADASAS